MLGLECRASDTNRLGAGQFHSSRIGPQLWGGSRCPPLTFTLLQVQGLGQTG